MKGLKLLALVALAGATVAGVSSAAGGGGATGLHSLEGASVGAPFGVRTGTVTASVELGAPSVAEAVASASLSAAEQKAHHAALEQSQDAVAKQVGALGAREVGRVTRTLNALLVSVDRSKLDAIQALPAVESVQIVRNYELDLSETVPHIGATALQQMSLDGSGVVVAVLDSGIDYTHESMGGPGTAAAYEAAYGTSTADPRTTTRDGLFPTAKVIDGFDFVGETWTPTSGTRTEDPDPIDCGDAVIAAPCAGGHGTHVADIIAGVGPAQGVAPAAKLLAYKVCSAVSTSCNGISLLKAVDAAMDPNGDGSLNDHADVINLSLGSSYGQVEDDLTAALNNAVDAGATVVASAGNSADRPYISGSPSIGENIISVAQTQVPSAKLYRIQAANATVGGLHQDWSAAPVNVTGPLVHDASSTGPRLGCSDAAGANPYTAGQHAGKILLVDRGTCAVSFKVSNGAAAGALAVIIANSVSQAPGDLPPSFSFGGGTPSVAGYTVTRVDGNCLKGLAGSGCTSSLGLPASIDPANAASLINNMVASSSRGPSYSTNAIKPDIGAPGGSLSAEAGTGTGETAFGGTSGAAPMVAGSAALLVEAYPDREPHELKAVMMNTAETDIGINPVGLPGFKAPITRIGAGEVRVDRAYRSTTAAWDQDAEAGSLSFGYFATADGKADEEKFKYDEKLTRRIVIHNYSRQPITYVMHTTFRYADDEATGAVKFDMPKHITVPAMSERRFRIKMLVDTSKLPIWSLNGGLNGGDGYLLNAPEFDGFLWIQGNAPNSTIHMPWHVLPHRAADVWANHDRVKLSKRGVGKLDIENKSKVLDGTVEAFTLTGESPQYPSDVLPGAGDNFAVVDLKAVGVRYGDGVVEFGIDTFGRRAHPNYPAEFDIFIDSNRDGRDDYVVFNAENGGFAATGQNVTAIFRCTSAGPDPCATGTTSIFFATDADLNSGNVILPVPATAIGLAPGQMFDFSMYAFDNYFTGAATDAIEGMTVALGMPRFQLREKLDVVPSTFVVPADTKLDLWVTSTGVTAAQSPSDMGFLFLYRDAPSSDSTDASRYEGQSVLVVP